MSQREGAATKDAAVVVSVPTHDIHSRGVGLLGLKALSDMHLCHDCGNSRLDEHICV